MEIRLHLRHKVFINGVMSTHLEVIAAFGGIRPLAEAIGVEPKQAIHWGRRGIPAKHWHKVVKVAPDALGVTVDDLERTKPATPGSAA
jgi:hypothetical protein